MLISRNSFSLSAHTLSLSPNVTNNIIFFLTFFLFFKQYTELKEYNTLRPYLMFWKMNNLNEMLKWNEWKKIARFHWKCQQNVADYPYNHAATLQLNQASTVSQP